MFSEQRQAIILDLIRQNGSVKLAALVEMFGKSEATVRRDLSLLENQGRLRRTHGGAVGLMSARFEADYQVALGNRINEKQHIARIAAGLVNEGDTVLLDSGSTTYEIARLLSAKDITIITNAINLPAEPNGGFKPALLFTGGFYRKNVRCCIGPQAEKFLADLRPDKAFIGTNGVLANECSTPDFGEASLKKIMLSVAKEKYLVADHSKFGKSSLAVFAKADQFDAIITDDKVSEETVKFYRSLNVPVFSHCYDDSLEGRDVVSIAKIMKPELINLNLVAKKKEDAIRELIAVLEKEGLIDSKEDLFDAVLKREAEFSTGIGMGIAIPHAKCQCVKEAAIAFGLSSNGVYWPGADTDQANLIFLIAVPLETQNEHLRLLAQISRKLVHENTRRRLLEAETAEQVLAALT